MKKVALVSTLFLFLIFSTTNSTIAAPHIDSMTPRVGSTGTTVTISGTGFGAAQSSGGVQTANGLWAPITSWSDAQIVCTVPSGAVNGYFKVRTDVGEWSNPRYFAVGSGREVHVCSESQLSSAISSCQQGDLILLCPRTYSVSDFSNVIQVPDVKLIGDDGAASTIFDINYISNAIWASGQAPSLVIDGITFDGTNIKVVDDPPIRMVGGSGTISNCVIKNGRGRNGGGIYYAGEGVGTIRNNLIYNCSATTNGGAIWVCSDTNMVIAGNVIANNSATQFGGGIYYCGASINMGRCDSNTFVANSCPSPRGSAIYVGGSPVQIRANIFSGNTGGFALWNDGTCLQPVCCDFWNNSGGNVGRNTTPQCSDPVGSNGNISANPLFCDYTNYYLGSTSPCVNAPGCGQIGARGVGCLNPPGYGIIAGNVKDASTQQVLPGVLIEALQSGVPKGYATTNSYGDYQIPGLLPGSYDVRASKTGYQTQTQNSQAVVADQTTTVNFQLTPSPTTGTIAGTVKDASTQQNLQGVLVEALQGGVVKGSANTNSSGQYSIPNLTAGAYDVRASKSGYQTQTQTGKSVIAEQTTTVDFQLSPLPKTLIFKDGSPAHNPIAYQWFQIYKVISTDPINEQLQGNLKTDYQGKVTLPDGWFSVNDEIKVEAFIDTVFAKHKNHMAVDSIAWYVKIDNGKFTAGGDLYYDKIRTDEVQEFVLEHTTFMFNLVFSVEWDASPAYLNNLENGIRYFSNYLYDVFDGQVCLKKVAIYDNRENFDDADVRVFASNIQWPQTSSTRNPQILNGSWIEFPRFFSGGPNVDRVRNLSLDLFPYNWAVRNTSYGKSSFEYPTIRNLAHEFGHYAFFFSEEYCDAKGIYILGDYDFGLMDEPDKPNISQNSEMSSDLQYDDDYYRRKTFQCTAHLDWCSCWNWFEHESEAEYHGIGTEVIKPTERQPGNTMFSGPNDDLENPTYDVGSLLEIEQFYFDGNAFSPKVCSKDIFGPIGKSKVTLIKTDGRIIEQGKTADNGWIWCLGVNNGDKIRSSNRLGFWIPLSGELVVNGSGVNGFRNVYQTFANSDSAEIIMRQVQGGYLLNNKGSFESPSTFRYSLQVNKSFIQNPGLEFYCPSGQIYNYNFYPVTNGYEAVVSDSLGSGGMFSVIAVDDSAYSFFLNNSYSITYLSDTSFVSQIYGPESASKLILDPLNTSFQKILILSSDFPPLLKGLDSLVEQAGEVHSISVSPNISNLNGFDNYLTIRYSDVDLKNASESSLKIFKWNEGSNQWEWIGGTVDTTRNEIVAPIQSLGIYAAFTTALIRGDVNGDKQRTVSDVVYMINYLFKGGPPPAGGLLLADVNCDTKVTVADVVYLINYLFKGGPPPPC